MASRITSKGQVTIPKEVRDELGLTAGTKVGFQKIGGKYVLVKEAEAVEGYLSDWLGCVELGMDVDEFLNDLRGQKTGQKRRSP